MLLRSRLELPVIFFSTLDEDWTSREQASPSLILRSSARFFFSAFLLFFMVFAMMVELILYSCCSTFSLNLTDFFMEPLKSVTSSSEMVVCERPPGHTSSPHPSWTPS